MLYIPRYFEFFVRGLPFGRPSWFLQGPASYSNLADLMVEFWSDSFNKNKYTKMNCWRNVADKSDMRPEDAEKKVKDIRLFCSQ